MFELTKTYTCNGCSVTATESKAKKWTHINNSPTDGKLSMDFCPKCWDMVSTVFTPVAYAVKEDIQKTDAKVTTEHTTEPSVTDDTQTTESDTAELKDIPIQYLDFYKQLYARALYAISCDNSFDTVKKYINFIPGQIYVDNTVANTDTQFTIQCNDKRVIITRGTEDSISTEIKIGKRSAAMLTRKVSKYSAVQTLVNDTTRNPTTSLLPNQAVHYELGYLKECIAEIDTATAEENLPLHELKEWIQFAAMQTGIELT